MSYQHETNAIRDELKSYLERFITSLASLPAYFPPEGTLEQFYQPRRLRTYHKQKDPHDAPRLASFDPSLGEDNFAERWLVQAPFWPQDPDDPWSRTPSCPLEWSHLRQQVQRAIILGSPGSGKTWLLKYEGLQVARAQLRFLEQQPAAFDLLTVPFYMTLPALSMTLNQPGGEVFAALVHVVQQEYQLSERLVVWMRQRIATFPCLLLLDGLDAVAPEQRPVLLPHLRNLMTTGHARCLLTSCPDAYAHHPLPLRKIRQERELELVDFEHHQIVNCLWQWQTFTPTPPEQQKQLEREIVRQAQAHHPALLSLLCFVASETGVVPLQQRRVWEDPHWEAVLALLAGCLPDASPLLEALLRSDEGDVRTWLLAGRYLVEAGKERVKEPLAQRVIAHLLHLPAQASPYSQQLAARLLARLAEPTLVAHLLTTLWDEANAVSERCAALWALGALGDQTVLEDVQLALWEQDRDAYGVPTAVLFLRCAAAWTVGRLGAPQALEELLNVLQEPTTAPLLRCAAAWALGQLGDGRALDALQACLSDQERSVQVAALWAIGQIGDARTANHLLARVEDTAEGWAAVHSLRHLGTAAVPGLLPLLSDPSPTRRWCVLRLLPEVGEEEAVITASLQALHDPAYFVRQEAVWALGYLGAQRASGNLLAKLTDSDEEIFVRYEAMKVLRTLIRLGNRPLLDQAVALVKAQDLSVTARDFAINAVAGVDEPQVLEALHLALQEESGRLRLHAAWALCEAMEAGHLPEDQEEQVISTLESLLSDEDSFVARSAAEQLAKIGGARVVNAFVLLLQQRVLRLPVQRVVVEVLGQREEPQVREALGAALLNPHLDTETRRRIIEVIEQWSPASALPLLWEVWLKTGEELRWELIRALSRMGEARMVEVLLPLLQEKDEKKRREVVRLLGYQSDPRAIEGLIRMMDDPSLAVACEVISALGKSEDPQALHELSLAAQSHHGYLRRTAALVLAERGDGQAVEAVCAVVRDAEEEVEVRQRAIRALGHLGDPVAMKELLAVLWDPDEKIRGEAAAALAAIETPLLLHFCRALFEPTP